MKFLLVLLFLVFSMEAFALLKPTPEEKSMFNSGRNAVVLGSSYVIVGNAAGYAVKRVMSDEGNGLMRMFKVDFDVSTDGGSTSVAKVLDVALPPNVIIEELFLKINTRFSDSGLGFVGIYCEDKYNFFEDANLESHTTGALVAGSAVGTIATFVSGIAASCDITVDVNTGVQQAGAFTLFGKYYQHD